ncbi:ISL3 family transposase [Microbacterium sp. A93]|uniref:ISL3 family transposase n=1 Tax=Microbacterium sp. A93 TaxID=3450716 RepID=UPI003F42E400
MRDTELYRHLLGVVAPWKVDRVELSAEDGRVDVWVVHPGRTLFGCPDCGRELAVYDHSEERAWRHLDSCAFLTFLHADPPRVACPEHGVRQARLPWAEPHGRFTLLFERLAIDVLQACDVNAAARLLRVSWDEAWHLMDRAVARGLAVKPLEAPNQVGVDEKAAGKGQDYITVVSDLNAGTVDYIADERRQASLDGYFERFTPEQLEGIQAVAMDMWEPFAASTRAHLSDAEDKIVFDRYHLMGYLTTAVDTVRKQENRALASTGDKALAGTKYLWLYSAENLPDKHQDRFDVLRAADLKTGRAWAIKEDLRHFWSYKRRGWAAKHFKRWYFWATHSRLKPIIDAAKTFKRHEAGMLSYFAHPITNAGAEGLNSRIQAIRVSARGYRNREHFKTAIYFHLGGLQLYPATP